MRIVDRNMPPPLVDDFSHCAVPRSPHCGASRDTSTVASCHLNVSGTSLSWQKTVQYWYPSGCAITALVDTRGRVSTEGPGVKTLDRKGTLVSDGEEGQTPPEARARDDIVARVERAPNEDGGSVLVEAVPEFGGHLEEESGLIRVRLSPFQLEAKGSAGTPETGLLIAGIVASAYVATLSGGLFPGLAAIGALTILGLVRIWRGKPM